MKGYIHSFESLAALDGEGLRCAVFLVGCPLRCAYCHNPDTWEGAGKETEAPDLVRKISRYKPYFGDNGGVTFSGGEPLLQAEFIKECAALLKEQHIGYVIDTSGAVKLNDTAREVLKGAQEVILDLKFWDSESYIKYTGRDIKNTLETLEFLEENGIKTRIRTVIVPEINDSEEILEKYFSHVEGKTCVKKYELLAFHTMGFHKYEGLGIKNPLAGKKGLEAEVLKKLQKFIDTKLK